MESDTLIKNDLLVIQALEICLLSAVMFNYIPYTKA